jgi:hypothetical protein
LVWFSSSIPTVLVAEEDTSIVVLKGLRIYNDNRKPVSETGFLWSGNRFPKNHKKLVS